MKNFIYYKNSNPVNMELVIDIWRDTNVDEVENETYYIHFAVSTQFNPYWKFEVEAERDYVFEYIRRYDCYKIPELLKLAYKAGQSGEIFDIDSVEINDVR